MSWSVSAVGKASAVAARITDDIARTKCSEPEETIKNNVGGVIATALGAFPPSTPVRVDASGSQSTLDPEKPVNQLSLRIEPIWGFIE